MAKDFPLPGKTDNISVKDGVSELSQTQPLKKRGEWKRFSKESSLQKNNLGISSASGKKGFSVNLMPEDIFRIIKEELPDRLKFLGLYVVLSIAMIIGIWFLLSWSTIKVFTQIQDVNNQINNARLEIVALQTESNEIVQLKDRYGLLDNLLKSHIYWTKFFSQLEKYTLPDVVYSNFAMQSTPGSNITLNAKAPDIETVARQLVVFQNASDFVEQVSINSLSVDRVEQIRGAATGREEVNFKIYLKFGKDVFYQN